MDAKEVSSSHHKHQAPTLLAGMLQAIQEKRNLLIPLLLFFVPLPIYTFLVPIYNMGDGFSVYIVIERFLETGSFNFWGDLNDTYNSVFFSYTYNDIVIKGDGEIYPLQFVGIILIYLIATEIGGAPLFYLISPIFGSLSILGVYFLSKELFKSELKAAIPAIILASSPLHLVWSVFPGNAAVSTCFFVFMVLFFIRCYKDFSYVNMIGFIFSITFMVLSRYPHLLLAIAPMFILLLSVLFDRFSLPDFSKRRALAVIFSAPVSVIIILFSLNYIWFGDPLFIAYIMKNNVPGFGIDLPIGVQTYFWDNLEAHTILSILNYIIQFFTASNFIHPFFLLSWFGFFLVIYNSRKRNDRDQYTTWRIVSIIFTASCLSLFIFYGASSSSFWNGTASLTLPHFRYLLPIYTLLPIFIVPIFEMTLTYIKSLHDASSSRFFSAGLGREKPLVLILIILLASPTVLSFNFAEIQWIDDADSHIAAYQEAGIFPPTGSVIMYGDRWPLLLLLGNNEDYSWFFYLGIPERYRNNETRRILDDLLSNGEQVLFFKSRYDSESQIAMFALISSHYSIAILNDTYVERFDSVFYSITFK